ncbi:MAG: alpha/beta hydrolase [Rhizobium sp.]|jgi:fermentation-respiration switch protein FrsA (DUF1100 family)|uniref:alpha/beta hydrolase n=1 Tax=Rhizobium sp. TaxID=391 RepID=UPI00056BA745
MTDEVFNANRREFLGASALLLSSVAVAASAGGPAAASTSAGVRQPAVIGYPNEKGVTIERVTYKARSMGTDIVANLFKPKGFDPANKYSTIVVTHPFGGVKEQTAGLYAQHLAEQGFVTLAYDASYQGESGGLPRLMEVPAQRLDDISCAIDYLQTQSFVDPGRIGSLGICAGGGYAMCNAQTESRVKAVATVSMFNLGEARREAMGNLTYEQRVERLRQAAQARSREATGGAPTLVPVVPESPAEFTDRTPDLYRQGYEYYVTERAKHPNSPNRYMLSSLPLQMAFFPFDQVETISPRPILMVVGEKADTKFWSDEVLAKAQAPKEMFVVPGATHMDMYDKPQFVTPAVEKLNGFFAQHLA